jgi:hypothetical protein
MLYGMSRKNGNVGNLYSFNFRLQKMVMQSFITQRKSNKHASFKLRRKKLYSLLKQLKRRIRYAGSRKRKKKDS